MQNKGSACFGGTERRENVTRERIAQNLTKVHDQLAALQERQKELEGQLRVAEDAEKMKFIEKNKISMERLILLNKISEEEILALLRKKEQLEREKREQQRQEPERQKQEGQEQEGQEQQIVKEAENHEKNEAAL